MIKRSRRMRSGEYKRDTVLTPLFMLGEVVV